uniref:Uncharacterized protein n=1 Tax=Oryza barthii TaxID=65489 RepID=A0A0D3H7Y3_9ORYZ
MAAIEASLASTIRFFDRTKLRHGAAAAGADGRRHRRDPPPLLGFIHHVPYNSGEPPSFARFVRTTAFRPAEPEHSGWWPLDCRHGRALFSSHGHAANGSLTVWDPITGDVRRQHYHDHRKPSFLAGDAVHFLTLFAQTILCYDLTKLSPCRQYGPPRRWRPALTRSACSPFSGIDKDGDGAGYS